MAKTDDHSATSVQTSGPKEELFGHFNQAVTTVRSYTNHFESEVARPAVGVFFKLFEDRPILATFLGTLTVLSFFPILVFVTASGVTLVSFVSVALVISLSAAFAVVIGFLFVLISTLVVSVFIAAIITDICFNVYLAFRLFVLVREKGASEGFSCWIGEVWSHFIAIGSVTLHVIPFPNYPSHHHEVQHQQSSEQSTEDSDYDRKVEGRVE